MPTLRVTDSPASLVIQVGEVLTVVAPAGSSAYVVDKSDLSPADTVSSETTEFGPYSATNHVTVTCTAGAVSFSIAQAPSAEGGTFASQAEAEAGEATDKYMSPLRVAQAIEALAPEGGTPADGSITMAKLADLVQATVIGRAAGAGTGVPGALSADQLKAILALAISDIASLQAALDAKAAIASPTLTGTPAAPTATAGTNTTQIATTAFVRAAVTALVDSSPGTLDTLNELAAALGDDPNFAATVAAAIALKANSASPSFTGPMTSIGASILTNTAHADYEVDVTLGAQSTPEMTGPETVTFSATPANGAVFGPVSYSADSGGPHTITIPESVDMTSGETITSVVVPASETIELTWRRVGSVNRLYGVPAASVLKTGMIPIFIRTVANETLRLVIDSPVELTITKVTTRSASGTCTATGQIDGTPLGGTANSASSTEQGQAHSSANVLGVGSDFLLALSDNSACLGLAVNVHYTYAEA